MRDPVLCRDVLETLLQAPVGELTTPEREKEIKITPDGKSIRLDIFAEEIGTGKIYDAEMQNLNRQSAEALSLPKRSRFYQAMIDFSRLKAKKTSNYRLLKDTDLVFICTFDPFGYGAYRYSFDKTCEDIPELKLGDGTRAIFYNTTSTDPDIPEEIRKLFDYINTGKVEDALTQKVDEAVKEACMDSDILEVAMRSEIWFMDAENIGYDRGLTEGEAQMRIQDLVQMLSRGGTEDDLRRFHDATDEEIEQAKERMLTGK